MIALSVDSESGGFNPKTASLLSIGVVVFDFDQEKILEEYESYVKLPSLADYQISEQSFQVHKITAEKAFNEGKPLEVIRDEILDIWLRHSCSYLAGHNLGHDLEFMGYYLYGGISGRDMLQSIFSYRYLDSMSLIGLMKSLDDVKSGASLKQAIKALNIDMTPYGKNKYHNALYDALASVLILNKCRKMLNNSLKNE